jgi:hypothetical protein
MRANDAFNTAAQWDTEWTLASTTVVLQPFIPVVQTGRNVPFYKQGSWGVVDFKKPYDQRSNEEKFDHDREVICDIFPEFVLHLKLETRLWLVDEFTRDMMEMIKSRTVSMWHAFSAQVLLDVHDTLGTKKIVPFNDLRITALRAKKNLTRFLQFTEKNSNPLWTKSADKAIQGVIDYIQDAVLVDKFPPSKKRASGPGYSHVEFHRA